MKSIKTRLCSGRTRSLMSGVAVAGLLIGSAVPVLAEVTVVDQPKDGITRTLFPNDAFTVEDPTHFTGRRVSLPLPDCDVEISACEDIRILNELDGFSTQPRITVPFSRPIDPDTITGETVFLVPLGPDGAESGTRVALNRVTWDPGTTTIYGESDELLNEGTRYLLIVTDGVKDTEGAAARAADREGEAMDLARDYLGGEAVPIAAAVFTTASMTEETFRMRGAVRDWGAKGIDFSLERSGGEPVRSVFDKDQLKELRFARQTGTDAFETKPLPLEALEAKGDTVGSIAYGKFSAPTFLNEDLVIPATDVRSPVPEVLGTHDVTVQIMLPKGEMPEGGWPVVIYGHGWGSTMFGPSWSTASAMAAEGLATVSISIVGHAGGPESRIEADLADDTSGTILSGGRTTDANGDGAFGLIEGALATGSLESMIGHRDTQRQSVADLMQLTQEIENGVDIDGDGTPDLNGDRIYYMGQSFGGMYGTVFTAAEPAVRAAVINVAGGSVLETTRTGQYRFARAVQLAAHKPSLINVPAAEEGTAPFNLRFEESVPARNQPVLVNTVPGALEIAALFDQSEWVQQPVNPVSYAYRLKLQPFEGVAPRPIIFQMAKGDKAAPNPTATAIVRAGDMKADTMYYRHDLAYAEDPSLPKDPHVFATSVGEPGRHDIALAAQTQAAVFFASDGEKVIDPDGAEPLFEMPIEGPLPETLNYIE